MTEMDHVEVFFKYIFYKRFVYVYPASSLEAIDARLGVRLFL